MARESVFPGRNGKILVEECTIVGEVLSCPNFAAVNSDGSGYRRLRANRHWWRYRWSPDGKRLLVATGDLLRTPSSIGLINPAGGRIKTIYRSKNRRRGGFMSPGYPDWLPGGKRLVFLLNNGTTTGIYTVGIDGTRLRKVRAFPNYVKGETGEKPIRGLSASPDGRRFAFWRYSMSGTKSIYVVNSNGKGLKRLAANVCDLAVGAAFDWTPDSKQILAAWQDDDTDPETDLCALPEPDSGIYLLPAAGGPPRRIFTEKFVRIFGQELIGDLVPQATFSPDGKLVAFIARRRYQGNGDLYDTIIVMRANGTDARAVHYAGPKVVNQGTGFWTPAWQPLPR